MRIVQVLTQMEAGGAQRVALLLTEALRNRGYEVEVWFLYVKRPIYMNFPGIRVLLDHQPSKLEYAKIASKLWQLLHSQKPDILITHGHSANPMGQFLARLSGVHARVAVQHIPAFAFPKIAGLIDWVLGTTNFYSANVAVSQAVLDATTKYLTPYKKKRIKIYNGIPQLKSETSPQEVRRRWALPENAPLLLNIGRLARQKNQSILLEVLLHLPEAHLLLVGEGELRESLQKMVTELRLEERVHFLGELKFQDVSALLSTADVFVFPSLYEAMPMSIIEAMNLGLPIVASDIPPLRESIGDAGIFVNSGSVEEIAKAVRQILDSSELANRLRMLSLERARLFSLENMVDSYEALFKSISQPQAS